jgi:hypothetical protein
LLLLLLLLLLLSLSLVDPHAVSLTWLQSLTIPVNPVILGEDYGDKCDVFGFVHKQGVAYTQRTAS